MIRFREPTSRESTAYDPNHVSDTGNYLVFHDIVGSSFTLSSTGIGSDGNDNGAAAPINGIQIVASAIPEPAFYQMSALGVLGGLGLLRIRRRK